MEENPGLPILLLIGFEALMDQKVQVKCSEVLRRKLHTSGPNGSVTAETVPAKSVTRNAEPETTFPTKSSFKI